ncbi:MAG: hypothetical protein RO257_09865 [Candidatus Kapabacteria bacterium]|jgi:hypothetical protein|nr:hypothetical protein [Candidatus Kapabacteria bacterium]
MNFEIISDITNIETIALGTGIKEINRLRKYYGIGKWRKMKGNAKIILNQISILNVELHWYEANGFGRKEFKIKRIIY